MFGISGDVLLLGTVAPDALYKTASEIQIRIDGMGNTLDIDNNSNKDALTDGLIILRYLFGLRGDVLISGVVASDAKRTSSSDIQSYLESLTSLNTAGPVITSASSFSVDENQTDIGVITATDADGDQLSFSLSNGDAELMSIDPITGMLNFRSSPDFEEKSFYNTSVIVSDGEFEESLAITVDVNDVNDAPYFTDWRDSNYALIPNPDFIVGESINLGDYIGAFSPRDQDGDEFTFSISGNELKIDGYDKIYFVSAPDFETKSFFDAILTISDGELSTNEPITVTLTDVDDTPPVFTSSSSFTAAENQTSIGTVTATDTDTDDSLIVFSISGSELSIDASSGVLAFNSAPDYETKSSYSATVTASDGTNTSTQDINVTITDIDETENRPPVFSSSNTLSAKENQTLVGKVTATDEDGDTLSYSLSGTDASSMSINSSSGVLMFNKAPDYETKSSYSVIVTASDGSDSVSQTITVNIVDVDDVAPVFTSSATFSAAENQTAIGTVTATDADSDTVSYSLSGTDASSMSINSSSGVLTFNSAPDYETKTSYTATVTASDGTNSATQDITVNILDANDSAPVFTSSAGFSAAENQKSIGTITTTDPDNDTVTYSLSGTDASSISINSSSGLLAFNSAPDYETKSSYSVTVTASDGTNSTAQTITVTITDVDDVAPVFTSNATFSAAENQTSIGTVTATDTDTDDASITFSISGSELAITSGGVLTFASAPDYETKSSYSATVTASDGTNSSIQDITVSVTNVNEKPVITSASSFSADENQTDIGVITVEDDSDNLTFELSGTDSSSMVINNVTGQISFTESPDYETKATYSAIARVYDEEFFVQKAFQVLIKNLNDNSPSITSSATLSLIHI